MILLDRDAAVYNTLESSNLAREVKGVQLSFGFEGGGVGGVPGGRNDPSRRQGFPGLSIRSQPGKVR